MESNDKTAEEILSKYETYVRHADVPIFLAENAIKAMHDYSAQKLKEYKEKLKEKLQFLKSGNHVIGIDFLFELIDRTK